MWDPYGGGNMVVLDGPSGRHLLLHNSAYEGGNRYVNEGDIVAYVGHTGNVTGTHSHWGLRINGVYVDAYALVNNNSVNTNVNMEMYTAQNGDTLSGLAARFGVNQDQIVGWNPGKIIFREDGDRWLMAGETYRVKESVQVNNGITDAEKKFEEEKKVLVQTYEDKVLSLKAQITQLTIDNQKSSEKTIENTQTISELQTQIDLLKSEAKTKYSIDIVDLGITGEEREILKEARMNLIKLIFVQFSKLIDRFPKKIRPVIYIVFGLASTLIGVQLGGIDLAQISSQNHNSLVGLCIAFVTAVGGVDQLAYFSKLLGDYFRDQGTKLS
jgi:murein DD-endopeptidase MepM/ murein hydrolase activator NlpD